MEYRKLATPPPLERMTGVYWYHGTPWYKSYQGIRRVGLQAGKVKNYDDADDFSPIPGMVYLTQVFRIAVEFALGTYVGVSYSETSDPCGYVFKFEGEQLEDVYLNEDILWLLLTQRLPDKLLPGMMDYITNLRDRFKAEFGIGHVYQGTHKQAKDFWEDLTEQDHEKLLEFYDGYLTDDFNQSIAHKGVLKPVACWRFNKNAVQEATFDSAYGNAPEGNSLFKKVF
jgi:hypothetical protein